jgi:hypothetical protein
MMGSPFGQYSRVMWFPPKNSRENVFDQDEAHCPPVACLLYGRVISPKDFPSLSGSSRG